jgi:predicted nucleic acid-binding protein
VTLALLDSNVLVAAAVEWHQHHDASVILLVERQMGAFSVSAHSYAETYAVLTSQAQRAPFRWRADEAWAAIEKLAARTTLIGVSHAQVFEAIRAFASEGRTGPLIYDRLIGEAAIHHRIPRILTWNVKHMRGLFPNLMVSDPASFGAEL